MAFDYMVSRERGDTIHSNPDEFNIGHYGENPTLSKRIETEWPSKKFKVACAGTSCVISFEEELSAAEETTLSGLVQAHKASNDWPP